MGPSYDLMPALVLQLRERWPQSQEPAHPASSPRPRAAPRRAQALNPGRDARARFLRWPLLQPFLFASGLTHSS